MKKLILKVVEETSDWSTRQEVTSNDDSIYFSVCDLSECPEDAIIGRDLFDAHDYIKAIKTGMELAKNGYTDVEEVWETDEDN